MDTNKISIMKNNYKLNDIQLINRIQATAQRTNIEVGYGDDSKEWRKKNIM